MSAIVQFISTSPKRLQELPILDGQLIFVADNNQLYLDLNGIRVCYQGIKIFKTEEDRLLAINSSIPGFYYVEETNCLWRFDKIWKKVAESEKAIFFGDREDFPKDGNSKMLYVSDNVTYRWDNLLHDYIEVSTKQCWETI